MAERPKYRQGRLLWAWLRSRIGKREKHPAIILTADQDIIQPEQFDPREDIGKVNAVAVIGVSTEYKRYPRYVRLPHSPNPGGHPITKLTQECGACIGWYDWIVLEDDVLTRGGDVPAAEMDQIMLAVARDFKQRLAAKADALSKELRGINELLARLMGEP